MASEGLILDISNEFLENLKKADNAIEKIANVSDNSKQRIIQMFQDIDKYGISHVINKTNEMKRGLELLANANIEVKGFKTIQENAKNAVDEINKLTESLSKLNVRTLSDINRDAQYAQEYSQRQENVKQARASKTESDIKEYQQLIDKIRELEQVKKQAKEVKTTSSDVELVKSARAAYTEANKELRFYKQRAKELEQQYAYEIEVINKQSNIRTFKEKVKIAQDAEKAVEKEIEKEKQARLKKLSDEIKAYQEYQERIKRLEQQRIAEQSRNRADKYAYTQRYGDTSNQAIAAYNRLYSENSVRSVQQMNKVISQMQQAQQKLNLNTADGKKRYDELGDKIRRVQLDLNKATGASEKFKQSQQSLSNITGQLGRQLATVFSVQQIVNYAKKVVNVRKEFELQHKSLQIILQDQDEANKLWQQTVDLALKSPFRVKELVTYTKQLAAYRIETEKLHDTTRMLADVSAGVGVDMQRLILAYGQVRAAEFLRGTELRQFTEAGVPLLEELATYFTELEGKAVSTAEAFARISKRQVLFEDVEAVLQKMTGVTDGVEGVFYKMQERQAQTLHGMISNLHDSIDLMMNDIGKANDSMMKDMVSLAKTVVDNWRALAVVIQQVGAVAVIIALRKAWASFLRLSPQVFSMSKGISAMSLTMNGLSMTTKRMVVAIRALTKAMLANPLFLGATSVAAVFSIIHAIVSFNNAIKENNKKYEEQAHSIVRSMDKLNEYKKIVEENNKVIKNTSSEEDKVTEARGKNAAILAELQKLYPENFENIKQNTDGTIGLNEAIKSQNELLEQQILLNELSKATTGHEDLQKNYSDVVEALGEVESGIVSTKASMISLKKELLLRKDAGKISSADYDNIIGKVDAVQVAKGYDEVKSAVDDLYKELENLDRKHFIELGDISRKSLSKMAEGYYHYEKDLETLGDNLDKFIDNVIVNTSEIEDNIGKSEWIDDMLKHLGIADKEIRKWSGEYIAKKIGIEFVLGEKKPKTYTTDDFKHDWQLPIWNAIEEIGKIDPVVKKQLRIDIEDIVFAQSATEIREKLEKTLPNLFGEQKDILKWEDNAAQLVYSPETIENAEKLTVALKTLMEILALEPNKKDKDKDKDKDIYAKRIKMIRDMAKAYEDLNDTFTNSEAQTRVIDSYSDAFADLFNGIMDIEDVDFTKPQGVVNALHVLEESGKLTAKQLRDVKTAIAEVSTEIDVKDAKSEADSMLQYIENMFGQYEISLELQKLNVPADFASALFGINDIDLSEIRTMIEQEIAQGEWGEDAIKKLREFEQKVSEMETKEQQERLETYLKYTRDAIGERAKIKLEELHKLDEIERTFIAKEGETPEETANRERAKQLAIQGVKREANEELQKLDWEALKSSDMFVNMFGDLENVSRKALDAMIKQLETYKDQWTDLPVDQMEDIAKQLEKMRKASAEKKALENPFTYFKKNKRITKQDVQDAEQTIINGQDEILGYDNQISKLEIINNLISEKKDATNLINEYNSEYGTNLTSDIKLLKEHKNVLVDSQKTVKNTVTSANKTLDTYEEQLKVYKAQEEYLGQGLNMANDLYDAFKGLYEALGGDEDNPAAIFADMGMNMAETIIQTFQLQLQLQAATLSAQALGIAMNSAMGIIGWIVMGVQLLAQAISAVVKAHDNNLQKQIELEQENVDELIKKYENLADAIDEAYNISQLEEYAAESRKYTEDMIDSYERMIALEEAKKQTDEDKIKELKKSQEEALKELADRQKELFSEVTDGILDSPKDAATEFVDAWLESFKEVGDGLQGLEESANEMIANLIKKQIALSIVSPYLEQWQKKLKEYIDPEKSDLTLSINEANDFADKVKHDLPYLSESLQNAFGSVSNLVDIFGEGGELAGLQKGIEGITEVQAEEITAYLNSLRFYVAQESEALVNLANKVLSTDETVNPMLAQLRIIASQTTAINELLNSLTTPFGNGGRGFKVVL